MRCLVMFAVVLLLSGCFSTSPSRYRPPASSSYFDLAAPIRFPIKKIAPLGGATTGELLSTRYTSKFEDSQYVYYACEGECVILGNSQPLEGGVRLPKSSAGNASLWIYVVASKQDLGLLINALDKAEAGRIREFGGRAVVPANMLTSIHVMRASAK